MTVERLDFSKPPPGYCIVRGGDGYIFIDKEGGRHQAAMHDLGHDWRQETAQSAAWAHHKARHDPPGMQVSEVPGPDRAWRWVLVATPEVRALSGSEAEARSAAWARYEDALEVADLLDGENGPAESWPDDFSWPQPLTWTSERRAKVRTLCLNGGDWSEVLRG